MLQVISSKLAGISPSATARRRCRTRLPMGNPSVQKRSDQTRPASEAAMIKFICTESPSIGPLRSRK